MQPVSCIRITVLQSFSSRQQLRIERMRLLACLSVAFLGCLLVGVRAEDENPDCIHFLGTQYCHFREERDYKSAKEYCEGTFQGKLVLFGCRQEIINTLELEEPLSSYAWINNDHSQRASDPDGDTQGGNIQDTTEDCLAIIRADQSSPPSCATKPCDTRLPFLCEKPSQ